MTFVIACVFALAGFTGFSDSPVPPKEAGTQTEGTIERPSPACAVSYINTVTFTVGEKSTNEPIFGASVVLKGTTNGTVTDKNGVAKLTNVPDRYTVVISFMGYVTQELYMNGSTHFIVLLEEDSVVSE